MRLNWDCFYDVFKEVAKMCSNSTSEKKAYINLWQMSKHLPQYEKIDVLYSMFTLSKANFVISEIIRDDYKMIKDIRVIKLTDKGYKELTKINS